MKKIVLLILFILIHLSSFAKDLTINGIIIARQDNRPIEYANIALMTVDSTLIRNVGCTTDSIGCFTMQVPKDFSKGFAFVSVLGYIPQYYSIDLTKKENSNTIYLILEEDIVQLSDVSINASSVIMKTDMRIALPTMVQKRTASNGFELLDLMSLPQLLVDRLRKTINVRGRGEAQIRINNILATTEEVFSILPKNVVKVEFYDTSGGQYGGEKELAVVNFIVNRPTQGGYISLNTNNGLNQKLGMNSLVAKIDYKQSELSLAYTHSYNDFKKKRYDEKTEMYYPSEYILKNANGINMPVKSYNNDFTASYNLTSLNSYVFNAMIKGHFISLDNYPSSCIIYNNDKLKQSYSWSSLYNRPNNISLDLYYEKNIQNGQSLLVNVVGTRIGTNYNRYYKENDYKGNSNSYTNIINGRKFSVISNIMYERKWKLVELNSGIKFTYGHNKDRYTGSNSSLNSLSNYNFYLFTQLKGKLQYLNYLFNIGFFSYCYNNNNERFDFYNARVDLNLNYPVFRIGLLSYQFVMRPITPMISDLADEIENIDLYRFQKGNPFLKPYSEYLNRLNFNCKIGFLNLDLSSFYDYYTRPIMDYSSINKEKIEISICNQRKFAKYGLALNMSLHLFDDFLVLRGNGEFVDNRSVGNSYLHKLTTWSGDIQALLSYKRWSFLIGAHSRSISLWGETVQKGDKGEVVELGYSHNKFKISIGIDSPFQREWNKCTQGLSSINPSESWMRLNSSRVFYLNLSWNISLGKRLEIAQQKLKNKDTDGGGSFISR